MGQPPGEPPAPLAVTRRDLPSRWAGPSLGVQPRSLRLMNPQPRAVPHPSPFPTVSQAPALSTSLCSVRWLEGVVLLGKYNTAHTRHAFPPPHHRSRGKCSSYSDRDDREKTDRPRPQQRGQRWLLHKAFSSTRSQTEAGERGLSQLLRPVRATSTTLSSCCIQPLTASGNSRTAPTEGAAPPTPTPHSR